MHTSLTHSHAVHLAVLSSPQYVRSQIVGSMCCQLLLHAIGQSDASLHDNISDSPSPCQMNLCLTSCNGCHPSPWLQQAGLQGSNLVGGCKHDGLLGYHDVDSMERGVPQLTILPASPSEQGPIRCQGHGVISPSCARHNAMTPEQSNKSKYTHNSSLVVQCHVLQTALYHSARLPSGCQHGSVGQLVTSLTKFSCCSSKPAAAVASPCWQQCCPEELTACP